MAVSLNAGAGFNSPLHARDRHVLRSSANVLPSSNPKLFGPNPYIQSSRRSLHPKKRTLVALSGTGTEDNSITAIDDSPSSSSQSTKAVRKIPEDDNGDASVSKTNNNNNKRTPLTARERLKAARVRSRYTETTTKTAKAEMGSKILDALKESDKKAKKKPGLPEAPTNIFDDSKRGLPPKGLTFDFPGGNDILVIAFSFVFISTVMFATTYVVWKLGGIHFNEY